MTADFDRAVIESAELSADPQALRRIAAVNPGLAEKLLNTALRIQQEASRPATPENDPGAESWWQNANPGDVGMQRSFRLDRPEEAQ